MPTIDENFRQWGAQYDWAGDGEEWSQVWGGSRSQWSGSILPRIRRFLPAGRALEIGCGRGRWSRRLRPFCGELLLVDLVPACVEACRQAFAGDSGVSFGVTDGRTLPGVPNGSLDFVFSFDSLVHAEADVLAAYLGELAAKLAPDGAAFLHHSNFGAVLADRPGTHNRHWRGESASADQVLEAGRSAGLACPVQEIVDWGGVEDCDCFTVVTRPGSRFDGVPVRCRNPFFMGEAQSLGIRARLYGEAGGEALPEAPPPGTGKRDEGGRAGD